MRYAKAQKRRQTGSSLLTAHCNTPVLLLGCGVGRVVVLLWAVTGLFDDEDAA